MASFYNKLLCPLCESLPEFTHVDGVSVRKCSNKECRGNKHWLHEYEWEMFQIENRKVGYYWVKIYSCSDWTVARWDGIDWHFHGKENAINELHLIDERKIKKP